MTEAEVIHRMRAHLEGLFPKSCGNCQRRYLTLREYMQITRPHGPAIPYDVILGDWKPLQPLGTVTLANCPCGNTLALTSDGMPLLQLWSLLAWAKGETARRGLSPQELLNHLRDAITRQVLDEPEPGNK